MTAPVGSAEPDTWPDEDREPLFVDVATLLAGGLPEPPKPVLLRRTDGVAVFYAGKVNILYGDPECGKTWIALAAVAEALADGRRCAVVDMDHNGAAEILSRLLLLGVHPTALANPDLFRLAEPDDAEHLMRQIGTLRAWRPAAAVVDSIGELLPLLEMSSNSPDDYTRAHNRVLSPLASAGAAVIGIDHMPKSEEARQHGQTGTLAKRRAVNGSTLHVTVAEQFVPGRGGAANMAINKDRPGGLRGHCPLPDKGRRQPAGRFVMRPIGDGLVSWAVTAPRPSGPVPIEHDPRWEVAAHLADLADQIGCPPAASRRTMQTAVVAAFPEQRHGNEVWSEAARIRKNRSSLVPDQGADHGGP